MKKSSYSFKCLVLVWVFFLVLSRSYGQTYIPVQVKGFNMDIIAEGTGNSSLSVTSDSMDQSDHVICSNQFASANGFVPSTFGLPNNGQIISGTKTYQLESFTDNNVLNIYTSNTETLLLSTPTNYTNISIAALATENSATINIIFNFTDGTSQTASNVFIPDWCTGTGTSILQSYGRLRRSNSPISYSDASNSKPVIFSFDYTLPCAKTLQSISFKNVSSTVVSKVTRAFIFAVSGVSTSSIIAPILNKDTVCKAGLTTLTVLNPQVGLTYNWYNSPLGTTLLTSGTSYSPIVFATTYYYVQAVNSAGCTSQMVIDTITLGVSPVLPIVTSPITACSGSVSLLVNNPQTGLTYQWYSASTGGVYLGTGNPYSSPPITGDTAFYVESVNLSGCESKRTKLSVKVLSPIGAITGSNSVCVGKSISLSDTSLNGNWGITNSALASISINGLITALIGGKDTAIYTRISSNGCKDTAFFSFVIDSLPVIKPIGGNPNVCKGLTTQLTENTTGGIWVNTNALITSIDNNGIVTGNAPGNAIVRYIVTSSKGCTDSVSINVNVKSTSTSTTNKSVCSSVLPYSWNGNSYNAAGSYMVHLTNAEGCDSVATLVLSLYTPTTSTTNTSICPSAIPYIWNGNSYNSAGTYSVHLINAAGCDSSATLVLSIKPTSSSTTNISICPSALPFSWNGNSYNSAGTYSVHLSNAAGCDSAATLILSIKHSSLSTTNISVCPSALPYLWNGNSYNSAGTYLVHLNNAVGCDSAATLLLSVKSSSTSTYTVTICNDALPYLWNGNSYNVAGSYNAKFINSVGCDSIATLILTVDDFHFTITTNPLVSSLNPIISGTNLTAQLNSATPISSSKWQPSGLANNQAIIISDSSFWIKVVGLSANNCSYTDSEYINVISKNIAYIPNAIVPSNTSDPRINTLLVYGSSVKSAVMNVYNQWGQTIFHSEDAKSVGGKGWDGTYSGQMQPTGVYVYTVKITYLNNKTETKSGSINLIR